MAEATWSTGDRLGLHRGGTAVALGGIIQGIVERPTALELVGVVPEATPIAALAYFIGVRPLLVLNHDGIVVRNFLRDIPIPWSQFTGVSAERIGLVVHASLRRQVVVAVPAGGRRVEGQQRTEVVAHEVAKFAADQLHLGQSEALVIPPAVISRKERRRERIAWTIGLALALGWLALMVRFIVTGH